MKVWILTWNHYDGSAHGVVRSYLDLEMGRADIIMLREHAPDRNFDLVESTLLGEPPEGPTFGDPLTMS